MLETSARLLRLLSLLRSGRAVPGPELASRLGVDVRTVRRDIGRLRRLGYPVSATRGSDGGYRLCGGAEVPPLAFDDDEAVAVVVGLRTAAGVTGIEVTALRALAKLEQALPARLRHRIGTLDAATVSLTGPGEAVDGKVLTVIAAACRDRERLRFGYRAHDGSATSRDVEPLRLASTGPRWYLLAFDLDRRDWRTFRVDRLTGPPVPGFRFPPREPPEPDVAAFITRSISSAPYRHRLRVLVHAPAEEVAGRIPPSSGLVEAVDDGSCVLHIGADDLGVVPYCLARHGVDFEATEPPELAARLREIAARLVRAAGTG